MKEGNVVGFRIFFENTGNLVTELNKISEEDILKVFKSVEDQQIMKKVLEQSMLAFSGLHEKIEEELNALNTKV
jgi:hypothetical protein